MSETTASDHKLSACSYGTYVQTRPRQTLWYSIPVAALYENSVP